VLTPFQIILAGDEQGWEAVGTYSASPIARHNEEFLSPGLSTSVFFVSAISADVVHVLPPVGSQLGERQHSYGHQIAESRDGLRWDRPNIVSAIDVSEPRRVCDRPVRPVLLPTMACYHSGTATAASPTGWLRLVCEVPLDRRDDLLAGIDFRSRWDGRVDFATLTSSSGKGCALHAVLRRTTTVGTASGWRRVPLIRQWIMRINPTPPTPALRQCFDRGPPSSDEAIVPIRPAPWRDCASQVTQDLSCCWLRMAVRTTLAAVVRECEKDSAREGRAAQSKLRSRQSAINRGARPSAWPARHPVEWIPI